MVGEIVSSSQNGIDVTPHFIFHRIIAAPSIESPQGSAGYSVNVGTDPAHTIYLSSTCGYYVASAAAAQSNQTTGFTTVLAADLSDVSTFQGCIIPVIGTENVTASSIWVMDPDLYQGDLWDARLVKMNMHESTLGYSPATVEIAHDQQFSISADQWNFFPEFSVSPALPAGVSIAAGTGEITGSASEAFGPTTFTVTRASVLGFPTQTVAITLSQLPAPSSAPIAYTGPVIEKLTPNPVPRLETLTISGSSFSGVSQVQIGDVDVLQENLEVSATEITLVIPEETALGQNTLKLIGSFGTLSYQNGVEITEALAATTDAGPRFEVREMANGDLKLYAFGIVNQGKIQFMVNGKEMAWVRATSTNHKKLRSVSFAGGMQHYLVRTLKNPGGKTIEIYQNSELMHSHN